MLCVPNVEKNESVCYTRTDRANVLKFSVLKKLLLVFHRTEFHWSSLFILFFLLALILFLIFQHFFFFKNANRRRQKCKFQTIGLKFSLQMYLRPRLVGITFKQNRQSGSKFLIFFFEKNSRLCKLEAIE